MFATEHRYNFQGTMRLVASSGPIYRDHAGSQPSVEICLLSDGLSAVITQIPLPFTPYKTRVPSGDQLRLSNVSSESSRRRVLPVAVSSRRMLPANDSSSAA